MAYQSGRNISVAYKAESSFNTAPGQTGSSYFRLAGGTLNLSKGIIQSNENRRDGMMTLGRHGFRSVAGTYTADLALGAMDGFLEGAFRSTFVSAISITEATGAMSSATVTVGAHTLTASAGSWITAGLRVGHVIRLGTGFVSGNQNRNLRVTGLTATVVTVQETLTTESALSTYTVTAGKYLLMGTTQKSFYVEEREIDIGASEGFGGVVLGQFGISMQPNSMAQVTFGATGADMTTYTSSTSPVYPYFTGSPTTTTSLGMTAVEASILLNGTAVLDLTGLNLEFNVNAGGIPVVGNTVTPAIISNLFNMSNCSITALRSDLARVTDFLSETAFSLQVLFAENESEPKDYCSFVVNNMTLGGDTKSNIGQDGPRTVTIPLVIGADDRGGAYPATMMMFQTSAA